MGSIIISTKRVKVNLIECNCARKQKSFSWSKGSSTGTDLRWGWRLTDWKVWHSVLNMESFWEFHNVPEPQLLRKENNSEKELLCRMKASTRAIQLITWKEMSKRDHLQVSNENMQFGLICDVV